MQFPPLENIERDEISRYAMFPIKDRQTYDDYKKSEASFWVANEVHTELSKDFKNWVKMSKKEQRPILYILGHFAVGDAKVNETINDFTNRIKSRELHLWYDFQKSMENVHNIVYSELVKTYVPNDKERFKLLKAHETMPVVKRKIDWINKWVGFGNNFHKLDRKNRSMIYDMVQVYKQTFKNARNLLGLKNGSYNISKDIQKMIKQIETPPPSLAIMLLINIIMEGVFFSGSFGYIFWINHQFPGLLPGLTKANEFISRDEGTHVAKGIHVFKGLKHKPSQELVHRIFEEAVDIEIGFTSEAMPEGSLNMNVKLMTQYVKFNTDYIINALGYKKIHNIKENPLPYTQKQSVSVRIGDFFKDHNITEYTFGSSDLSAQDQELDPTDEDF
jgi:ribonucleoside-diphosphate reductase subunit M2